MRNVSAAYRPAQSECVLVCQSIDVQARGAGQFVDFTDTVGGVYEYLLHLCGPRRW